MRASTASAPPAVICKPPTLDRGRAALPPVAPIVRAEPDSFASGDSKPPPVWEIPRSAARAPVEGHYLAELLKSFCIRLPQPHG